MMLLNSLTFLSLILASIGCAASLERAVTSRHHEEREIVSVVKRMVAASKLSKLAKRSDHLELCNSFDLEYTEGEFQ